MQQNSTAMYTMHRWRLQPTWLHLHRPPSPAPPCDIASSMLPICINRIGLIGEVDLISYFRSSLCVVHQWVYVPHSSFRACVFSLRLLGARGLQRAWGLGLRLMSKLSWGLTGGLWDVNHGQGRKDLKRSRRAFRWIWRDETHTDTITFILTFGLTALLSHLLYLL
jgi:hypothetical protein